MSLCQNLTITHSSIFGPGAERQFFNLPISRILAHPLNPGSYDFRLPRTAAASDVWYFIQPLTAIEWPE